MIRYMTTLAGILIGATLMVATFAQAPQDVPREHWAYSAVDDLAGKGLIKGFPPNGEFFGKRTVTRYEMAVVIQRILARVDELLAKKAHKGEAGGGGVKPEQLDEVRRLVAEYKTELTVIGTDLQKVKDQIGEVSAKADAAQRSADEARAAANKASADAAAAAQAAAGASADLKKEKDVAAQQKSRIDKLSDTLTAHKISGYIQARFDAIDAGRTSLFTSSGAGGTGQTPTNGAPSVGGPFYGFQVRRARVNFSGPITKRTEYRIQVDAQSGNAVGVYDANILIRDLPMKNAYARFGMFSPVFGFELPTSSSVRESPERAFGWGTTSTDYPIFKTTQSATGGVVTPGSVVGLFLNQQRDVGAEFGWEIAGPGADKTKLTLSVINGEGRSANGVRNLNNGVDVLGRIEAPLLDNKLKLGLSGYYGSFAVRGGAPTGTPATPVEFVNADKILIGGDVRWLSPWGTSFRAEYVGGTYEATPDRARYLDGNHAQAWYFAARHPLTRKLDLVAKYDEFMPIAQKGVTAGGLSRTELIRKTLSLGTLYQLDEATRLRLWYAKGLTPYDPSATSGPLRSRLGLITGEVQVTF